MSDARHILGVGPDAGDAEVRAAYLKKVKEHPPDRSPEEFEKIRDAYETLRDPRKRARDMLAAEGPVGPLASLVEDLPREKSYAGPQLWLEVLKGK